MWWINRNGNVEGPFTPEQLEKRIKLNMLRSLDRVSEDRSRWFYVKDTEFWNPTRTLEDPAPQPLPPSRAQRMKAPEPPEDRGYGEPAMAIPAEPPARHRRAVMANRLRMDAPAERQPSNIGVWLAVGVTALLAIAIVAVFAFGVIRAMVSPRGPSEVPGIEEIGEPDSGRFGFNAIKDKLVIIECDEGSGTGFLVKMDGRVYLMTNEHVVRSVSSPRARLLDGTPLALGEFSVATDRDLARFEIAGCPVEPLEISRMLPNTGDMVAVYGNSLGGGVATESKGFIQGVGPERLETNTEIVPGNSGSPLIAADGKVLGVAAFIDRRGSDEWTVKNTRYEGNPRRFAIRFTGVAWKVIDRRRYEQQIANLNEFEVYWQYLLPYLCFDSSKVEKSELVFDDMKAGNFHQRNRGYAEMLTTLSKAYRKSLKNYEIWDSHGKNRDTYIQRLVANGVGDAEAKRGICEYDRKTEECRQRLKESIQGMINKRKEALLIARGVLDEGPWDAPQVLAGYSKDDRNGCVEWYREGIVFFTNLMNQKLKDVDKLFESGGTEDDDED